MAMTLVDGGDKSVWWALTAAIMYWWEGNVQTRGGDWVKGLVMPMPEDVQGGGSLIEHDEVYRALKLLSDLCRVPAEQKDT